jgi:hypothetical protein
MGGYGLGRRRHRGVLEQYRQIDVNRFRREGILEDRRVAVWYWSDAGGRREATMLVLGGHLGLEFLYAVDPGTQGEQQVRCPVGLDWTPCHFGGERPWFLCPNSHCGRRVAVLYLAGTHFICRHCVGAAYASQNETDSDRLARKARRIRAKLGADMNLLERLGPWDRPKGMHWRTFQRLWRAEVKARRASFAPLRRRLGMDLGR